MKSNDYTFNGRLKHGFTLAEVLITLGIIGVVAALTIPTLMSKYQKKVWAEGAKISFSMLQEGFKKSMADDGVNRFKDTVLYKYCFAEIPYGTSNCTQTLSKYFKISKFISQLGNSYNCDMVGKVPMVYYELDKRKCTTSEGIYIMALENGMFVGLSFLDQADWDVSDPSYIMIEVDINGLKAPNTIGRDVFSYEFFNDGVLTGYASEQYFLKTYPGSNADFIKSQIDTYKNLCKTGYDGYACINRIIDNGWVMDY